MFKILHNQFYKKKESTIILIMICKYAILTLTWKFKCYCSGKEFQGGSELGHFRGTRRWCWEVRKIQNITDEHIFIKGLYQVRILNRI